MRIIVAKSAAFCRLGGCEPCSRHRPVWLALLAIAFWICIAVFPGVTEAKETPKSLSGFLGDVVVSDFFPGASRVGPIEGSPPGAAVFGPSGEQIGYVFLNTDLTPAVGYSGKPIYIIIGVDNDGVIRGAKMVKHSEPIVLVGIPVSKVDAFIDGYTGLGVLDFTTASENNALPVDIVSGATVTVIIIDDSIKHAVIGFSRSRGLAGLAVEKAAGPERLVDMSRDDRSDWTTLLGEGAVRRLNLANADIDHAFEESGNIKAIGRPEAGPPEDVFIDLYAALVSVPTIGRTLLGDAEYGNLVKRLQPGQQAVLIMANGHYSFRGSGFVRGGVFDRHQVIQGEASWLFRDKSYKRIATVEADDAPDFSEIGLFLMPADDVFDPTARWRVQLLIQRPVGPIEKAFVTRELSYQLPESYTETVAPPSALDGADAGKNNASSDLWKRVWSSNIQKILILTIAGIVLTGIFFLQVWLSRRPKLLKRVRTGFLVFTLVWLGWYANGQLSVVNIFAYANALLSGFSWEYFLMDPMLFILWAAVAASLIFWGRGVFCGWLCPFGALQELLNMIAKRLKVPQFMVPWQLHELLWPIKYVIFLALFGLSLYSLELAEVYAEVEPFKTAIILKFAREWPFVIYALTILSLGLFVERFYCRYLCPLGAALAIPGRLRINDWLKRYRQCGNPCQRCSKECMVQAIHPEGHINVNECLYCLHCQELYRCDQRCPVQIQKRLKRKKRQALSSSSMRVA